MALGHLLTCFPLYQHLLVGGHGHSSVKGLGAGMRFIEADPLMSMEEVEPWRDRAVSMVGHREEESGDLLPDDSSSIIQRTL